MFAKPTVKSGHWSHDIALKVFCFGLDYDDDVEHY